ncbi:MAG TPA: type II toxin-antitoxin system HigB family toxin [Tepidisphaeraceae bacterium]|jgi:mRNA interferase HigB
MRVISKRRLREFFEKHSQAREPLLAWYKAALAADWSNIQEVRQTYAHADAVTLSSGLTVTVFNIGGGKYRLIARMIFEYRRVYVKLVLTHAEYSRESWKRQLCRE